MGIPPCNKCHTGTDSLYPAVNGQLERQKRTTRKLKRNKKIFSTAGNYG
jgi:hypothetical protein